MVEENKRSKTEQHDEHSEGRRRTAVRTTIDGKNTTATSLWGPGKSDVRDEIIRKWDSIPETLHESILERIECIIDACINENPKVDGGNK